MTDEELDKLIDERIALICQIQIIVNLDELAIFIDALKAMERAEAGRRNYDKARELKARGMELQTILNERIAASQRPISLSVNTESEEPATSP